jgi:hypothetical protein
MGRVVFIDEQKGLIKQNMNTTEGSKVIMYADISLARTVEESQE